ELPPDLGIFDDFGRTTQSFANIFAMKPERDGQAVSWWRRRPTPATLCKETSDARSGHEQQKGDNGRSDSRYPRFMSAMAAPRLQAQRQHRRSRSYNPNWGGEAGHPQGRSRLSQSP